MQFILSGFTQELGFRVFVFERLGEDRVHGEGGYGPDVRSKPISFWFDVMASACRSCR